MRGKRLGYTSFGAITHLMAIDFAQKMGWSPDRDISLIADGTAFDALASGREDAFDVDSGEHGQLERNVTRGERGSEPRAQRFDDRFVGRDML